MVRFLALGMAAVLVGIDQVLKNWASFNLVGGRSIEVIPGLFKLTYVENYGAAFGILRGRTLLLTVVVAAVLVVMVAAILSGKIKESGLIWTLALVTAGGAGNLIDRARLGYVVDYLDFSALFGFPVFNFADCCVVVGSILLMAFVLISEQKEKKQNNLPGSGGGQDAV